MMTVAFDVEAFRRASPLERRYIILDLLCAAIAELSNVRGWDSAEFAAACNAVRENGISYSWESSSKLSPDRKLAARVVAAIDESGAIVKVVVQDRSGQLVAESRREILRLPHPQEIEMRCHSLRWLGNMRVVLESRPIRGSTSPSYPALVWDLSTLLDGH
jgi:hypothetical protein